MSKNATLAMASSTIQNALEGAIHKLVDDNMHRIITDLEKSSKDIGSSGIALKISTPLQFTGSRVYMEPAIEWERKNKSKVDGKPVNIDLNQTEFNLTQDQE